MTGETWWPEHEAGLADGSITFNLHSGSTGARTRSRDRLQVKAWLHCLPPARLHLLFFNSVTNEARVHSIKSYRGHFSFGSRHPTPYSLIDTATTTGLASLVKQPLFGSPDSIMQGTLTNNLLTYINFINFIPLVNSDYTWAKN